MAYKKLVCVFQIVVDYVVSTTKPSTKYTGGLRHRPVLQGEDAAVFKKLGLRTVVIDEAAPGSGVRLKVIGSRKRIAEWLDNYYCKDDPAEAERLWDDVQRFVSSEKERALEEIKGRALV